MNATNISGKTKISDALLWFYEAHGLGEKGGEDERWARVEIGWFHFYIPNLESRKRALFFHDVHHLVTGYQTDLKSEAEIGAWEVASGCRDYWAAWILNYLGLAIGLLIAPRRTFYAFVRGRNSRNLYDGSLPKDVICESTIDDIQEKLGLDQDTVAGGMSDVVSFLVWTLPALLFALTVVSLFCWMVF